MICLLSPTEEEAQRFARSHYLAKNEYFWANNISRIQGRINFHVLIVGAFLHDRFFENLLAYAQNNGAKNRK
jgi:hypothetical protein